MDITACHSHRCELMTTTAWGKEDVKQWFLAKTPICILLIHFL